ncbi:hypothetical protein GG681_05675 [Epibacterium sp. SM1969]|uniref:Uncharacterized protein n=1 Tax=Tritonibacter aquimaris TaxID=2663379 RepID=A0A844AVV3_9RHOB|nr:hypothetical protein [Tritonibacter aquimaris]MQY42121.1 hypothetical protein [Tritonibacter aquimaris]
MVRYIYLLLFSLLAVCAQADPLADPKAAIPVTPQDADLRVIVERSDQELSFFLALPVDQMEPLLGTDLSIIFSDDGKLPLDDFQRDGSFELADDVFAAVSGAVGGTAAIFDPMSMMLHPNASALPFSDPFDGILSTSVCGVFIAPEDQVPERMTAYYGGIFLNVAPNAPVQLDFPKTGRSAITVKLRQYDDSGFVGETTVALPDGGALVLFEPWFSRSQVALAYLLGLVIVLLAGFRFRQASRRAALC